MLLCKVYEVENKGIFKNESVDNEEWVINIPGDDFEKINKSNNNVI
jgi:hypothetical protein